MKITVNEFDHKLHLIDVAELESIFKDKYANIDVLVHGGGYRLKTEDINEFKELDKQAKMILSANIFLKILIKEKYKKEFTLLTQERESEIKELENKTSLNDEEKGRLWQLNVITNRGQMVI